MVVATETAVFWNMTPCILVQARHLFPCIKVTQSNRLNMFYITYIWWRKHSYLPKRCIYSIHIWQWKISNIIFVQRITGGKWIGRMWKNTAVATSHVYASALHTGSSNDNRTQMHGLPFPDNIYIYIYKQCNLPHVREVGNNLLLSNMLDSWLLSAVCSSRLGIANTARQI